MNFTLAIQVQAVQLTQETVVEVCEFVKVGRLMDGDPQMSITNGQLELFIPSKSGVLKCYENDWIVKDLSGFHPVDPEIFKEMYKPC